MKTIERTFVDKTSWGEGPWQDEPDKVQWEDSTTKLPCLIVRNPRHGNWCGYVGLAPDHPLHGEDYETPDVDVHGGLTFAGLCNGDEEQGICHVPEPGEPDPVWWFGFDCAHLQDVMPGMGARLGELGSAEALHEIVTYKTLGYVKAETTDLARQLASASRDA